MQYEVEQKHRVDDVPALVARLAARGATLGPPVEQIDQYFAHPCRDFAQTDEALRVRTIASGSFLTYKGPKLDTATKTRGEIELPLNVDEFDKKRWIELLTELGFTIVAHVRKQRQTFRLRHAEQDIEGVLDTVESLGTFVELEILADATRVDESKRLVAELAADLDLGPSERRSYLEMLLETHTQRRN